MKIAVKVNIKKICKEQYKSVHQLAKKCGIHYNVMLGYANAEHMPEVGTAILIAMALNKEVTEVWQPLENPFKK